MLAGFECPVAALDDALPAYPQQAAGTHLVHPLEYRPFGRLDQGKLFTQAIGVDDRSDERVGENSLGLRAEQHAVRQRIIEQRLDAHAVADEEQFLAPDVPQREREYAVEMADDLLTPLEIAAQQDLGVAAGPEPVTFRLERLTEFPEVVDLSAVGDHGEPVRRHGLVPALNVDDRQPPVAERHVPVQPDSFVVGSAVGHGPGHGLSRRAVGRQVSGEVHPSRNSAHLQAP